MIPFRATSLVLPCILGLGGCFSHPEEWYSPDGPFPAEPPPAVTDPPPGPGGPVTSLDPAPPPISGGTLLITRGEGLAVAADPDRDRVWIVKLPDSPEGAGELLAEIPLEPGDEPGRLVEGADGRVHVALRGGGAVATIDLARRVVVDRRNVCAGPRGLAHDEALGVLHVACVRGELVTLPEAGGPELRRVRLDEDLRDVVVDGDRLLVSRFRAAEVLILDASGAVTGRVRPPDDTCAARVAWRMVGLPGGGAALVHQRAQVTPIETSEPNAYQSAEGACGGGIVATAISILPPAGAVPEPALFPASEMIGWLTLPVDLAVSPDRRRISLVGAGSHALAEIGGGTYGTDQWTRMFPDTFFNGALCPMSNAEDGSVEECEPIAVAYDARGQMFLQSREPAMVAGVRLPAASRADTGHKLFHQSPGTSLSCASCHPEGREDGHTWFFKEEGLKRTQALHGGVATTAPFHWDGSLPDLAELMDVVFVQRMGGSSLEPDAVAALGSWLDKVPALPPRAPADAQAAARGAQLFADPTIGCAGCHGGQAPARRDSVAVGTGAAFQVPRLLGLGARAPYMHDGCAPTLLDRFGTCGGDAHGATSQLTAAQLQDLIAYLETL